MNSVYHGVNNIYVVLTTVLFFFVNKGIKISLVINASFQRKKMLNEGSKITKGKDAITKNSINQKKDMLFSNEKHTLTVFCLDSFGKLLELSKEFNTDYLRFS